ncbi:MAG: glycosyltransferase family 2 protein [Thermincola sp.]|jgi:glycosyltransferase involved in cell wall biosynthesis|nr:glycosyltransferase family 2 protein [Thermincola sp.]
MAYRNNEITKDKKILIIIPAYNEELSISKVISGILQYPGIDVVVINDGSKDNTSAVARRSGADVIDLPFNLGIGGAVQTGYLYAFKNGYDIAVQCDADGQHDSGYLMRIIEPVRRGEADMVVGSRYVQASGYKTPVARKIGMLIFAGLVSLITGQSLSDTTSGYRAVSKRVIKFFAHNYPTDFPEVEALVLLKRNGFTIKEVPVKMAHREHGVSSITPVKSIYYMIKVLLAIFMNVLRASKKEAKMDEI